MYSSIVSPLLLFHFYNYRNEIMTEPLPPCPSLGPEGRHDEWCRGRDWMTEPGQVTPFLQWGNCLTALHQHYPRTVHLAVSLWRKLLTLTDYDLCDPGVAFVR